MAKKTTKTGSSKGEATTGAMTLQQFKKQFMPINAVKQMFNGCNSGSVRTNGHPIVKNDKIFLIISKKLFNGTKYFVIEFNPRMDPSTDLEIAATKLTHSGAIQHIAQA